MPRVRRALQALAISALCAGCEQPLSQVEQQVAAIGTAAAQVRSSERITLDFDLPSEFAQKDGQGQFVITGFVVGYFIAGRVEPVQTVDVARSDVSTPNGAVRLSLPRPQLPPGVGSYILRLKTVSKAGASEWSEPSPVLYVPGAKKALRAAIPGKRTVSPDAVAEFPALSSAMSALVAAEPKRSAAMSAYRTLDELALAVVVSRREGVSFEELSTIVKGPPRRSLRRALRQLKPAAAKSDSVQAARGEARQLLTPKSP